MSTRAVIDVSELPHHEFDTYDPVWWGNNLLLAIETSMFAILIATYFYLRQNFPALAATSGPTDRHSQSVAATRLRHCEHDPVGAELRSDGA